MNRAALLEFPHSEAPLDLARLLEEIRGRRVLVVGDLILDVYVYGETRRVSREAPVLVVRKEREEYRLGGAANTAANLAALGVNVTLMGAVGDDEGGRRLCALVEALGVDTRGVRCSGSKTTMKTRILAGAQGTARQQVLRIDDERTVEDVTPVDAGLLSILGRQSDAVIVSDYGDGLIDERAIGVLQVLAHEACPVCVDSRYRLEAFTSVTAVTPNAPEAAQVAGFYVDDAASAERAGKAIVERLQSQACLLTQGRMGMTLFQKDAPSDHVDIVGGDEVTDVSGAGDTVIATFGAALAAGQSMSSAMRLANCAAGVVVHKVGTATASPEEILAYAARFASEEHL